MISKKKLALIHIIKKELNLEDGEYRNTLRQACGVDSAKELDEAAFRKLMNFFVRSKYYQVNRLGLTLRQKLYIKNLSRDLNWEEEHLNNFLHKYYHKPGLDKLTRKEAAKAIEALKNILERSKPSNTKADA